MNRIVLISAVCMQIGWISGVPHPEGVGAYAYQDSTGNRYGGTFGLNGEKANLGSQDHPEFSRNFPVPFGLDFDDFFPEYFRNFENLLQDRRAPLSIIPQQPCYLRPLPPLRPMFPFKPQLPPVPLQPMCSPNPGPRGRSFPSIAENTALFQSPMKFRPFPTLFPPVFNRTARAFDSNKAYQRQALKTAKKAYEITSNQAGFMPHIDFSRFSTFGVPQFHNFGMPSFGNQNSAYAAGAAAPGYTHQFAGLSPANPNMPNVDVTNRFAENGPSNGYMSVSSSAVSSSSNMNGKQETHRSAETLVNNNGKVTHYKVQD